VKKIRGFSLIEATVALALMGVIVVTIMSAFSAVTIAAAHHKQATTLDLLTRSDTEYIKSQTYSASPATYLNLTSPGYSFSYQVLYYAPGASPPFSAANPDNGLEELVLTVSGPNGATESLTFLKVHP